MLTILVGTFCFILAWYTQDAEIAYLKEELEIESSKAEYYHQELHRKNLPH